jgi:exopolyphosphatase/guanosine-5'-triphosphate,3'-diphosphate pyrophosphatase
MKYAIIDIGTNSTRMMFANTQTQLLSWEKYVTVTRIGKDVNKSKTLSNEGIKRTLDTLNEYLKVAKDKGYMDIHIFATSAVRDANNSEEFSKLVFDRTGYLLDIISGEDEALIGFSGSTMLSSKSENILMIDIGGGSTEIVIGNRDKINFKYSYDIGALRLNEMLGIEEYNHNLFDEAVAIIEEITSGLKDFAYAFKPYKVIGIGGTITTQLTVRDKISTYNREIINNQEITIEDIEKNLKLFLNKKLYDRKNIIGLNPQRADIITSGTIILMSILKIIGEQKLAISDFDNLEGYFLKKVLTQ